MTKEACSSSRCSRHNTNGLEPVSSPRLPNAPALHFRQSLADPIADTSGYSGGRVRLAALPRRELSARAVETVECRGRPAAHRGALLRPNRLCRYGCPLRAGSGPLLAFSASKAAGRGSEGRSFNSCTMKAFASRISMGSASARAASNILLIHGLSAGEALLRAIASQPSPSPGLRVKPSPRQSISPSKACAGA